MKTTTLRVKRIGLALLAAGVLVVAPLQAGIIAADLLAALEDLQPGEQLPVIATLAQQADAAKLVDPGRSRGQNRRQLVGSLKDLASSTQGPIVGWLNSQGVAEARSLWIINSLALRADAAVILGLAEQPGVASVRLDASLQAPTPETAATAVPEWNLAAVGAPDLWALGITGAGVVVAAMDTGVDAQHPDLASRYRGGTNSWLDPNGEYATPYDNTGHGTQVMGLMVGGDAGGTAIGMAPDAQWIAVKIFDSGGSASLSGIHAGFQWLLDPDGDPGSDDAADVVNSSWGYAEFLNQCYLEFEPDLEALKAADIAVVFSAGNQGPTADSSEPPANNPAGYAAGSVDDTITLASFSAHGPSACDGTVYPEVVAPGVSVWSSDLTFGGVFPDSYKPVSGTSFAAPHVAGAMALLRSAHPGATVADLETALLASAADLGPGGPDNGYGYGLIDVVAADAWLAAGGGGPVCTDTDADGFFVEAGCGTELDCDDADPGINPAACDIKGDGIDQDCDGADRTKGKPCPGGGDDGGGDTAGVEGKGQTCSDGLDNDGDGAIDCGDPDCARNKSCK